MTILFQPGFVAIDGNGNPYAGAKLYFYVTGTTTNQNTYSDSVLSSANTNPVVADANGLFGPIYLDPTLTYKAVLKTTADVTIWTRDPIGGPSGIPVIQTFSATGTYTPTAGMVKAIIECWGGGGAGGGVGSAANGACNGGGGGAGGYSRKLVTKADIGASKAVTIGAAGAAGSAGNTAGGAGGDTSVGALCIGKGGSGGAGGGGASSEGLGGNGGVAGTGDVTATGMNGGSGVNIVSASLFTSFLSGFGASSMVGGGGQSVATTGGNSVAGNAGTGFASGGSGACSQNSGGTKAGGAGTAGYVIITEYIG